MVHDTSSETLFGQGRLGRRSALLHIGALGAIGLTLPVFLRWGASARAAGQTPAAARNAILIFLGGGPSHLDTFDPKPEAPAEIRGAFGTVESSVKGVRFSDSIPLLAAQMHHLAVLRALSHRQAAHEAGVAYMATGYAFRPGHNFPSIGAVVSHENLQRSRETGMPPYFGLPNDPLTGGGGHLGPSFNALPISANPNDPKFRIDDLSVPDGISEARAQRRRQLAERVNAEFRQNHVSDARVAVDHFTEQAYRLMTSARAHAAMDLNLEKTSTRDRYGRTTFGQRLLLARRLIEAGVPFVHATDFGWDDHTEIFPKLKQRLPVFDQGVSALIEDLDQRGLLESTLVMVMGEFGRTPKINKTGGRDHWSDAFSVVLAGGGVHGGQVIGASDAEGAHPKDRPVTPEELIHSIYVLLGIDPGRFLPSTSGRDIQIVRDGKFIPELTS
jgi:uncharacterized protein (DUF1501 family)